MAKAYLTMAIGAVAVGPADDGGATNRYLYSGDGTSTWKRGQLLKLASGVVGSVVAHASAGVPNAVEIDSDDMAAGKYFLAMEDQDTVTTGLVPVRQITDKTIFEGELLDSNTGATAVATAPESIVGTDYELYQSATGAWSVDKYQTAKAVVKITAVEGQFQPVTAPSWQGLRYVETPAVKYNLVRFQFLPAIVLA